MLLQQVWTLWILLLLSRTCICANSLKEELQQTGYLEIFGKKHPAQTFDSLYSHFEDFIQFLQRNPVWAQKLYSAKERFVRSPDRKYYSTDFFGLYDETKKEGRRQISFYYSTHFHEFIGSHYPEYNQVPQIAHFFNACWETQKPYEDLLPEIANGLGIETIFCSQAPPLLLKVIKYLPSYTATRPHYDGSAFSLFLDSTDNKSLLLSPYKPSCTTEDFSSPLREVSQENNRTSLLLVLGSSLTEFSIYPTPHIVSQSGKTRYATIAFCMRPYHTPKKLELYPLPFFKH